jgi:Tol biopolymer transport system component
MRRMLTGLLLAGFLMAAGAGAQQRPQDLALQAAIRTETVTGDLRKAIAEYQAIVDTYLKTDRGAAANALLRMADCYQKLGDQQATKLFERVVREFGDQKEAVQTASGRLGGLRTGAGSAMMSRQVWTGKEVDTLGTVSPDGRYLSFTDWRTGDLAVRDLSTGTSLRLTDKGPWTQSSDYSEETAISRDGSQIAYAWYNSSRNRYELRILRTDAAPGSAPRVVFENPDVVWIAPYDWSPDGKRLAVQVQRLDRTAQIGIISVSDGGFRPLKSIDWRGTSRMFFSPDGSLVAYDLPQPDTNVGRDVYLLSVDGTREVTAAQHPSNDMVVGWSPDGNTFLFASDRAGSIGLWSVPIVNGQPSGAPALIKSDMGALESSLGVTRRGTLAYAVRTSAARVVVVGIDFQTGKQLSAPTFPFETYLSRVNQADWSRDGKYLVAVQELSRMRSGLTIRTADGGRVRDLSTEMAYFQRPQWAPDGSITVQGVDLKGHQGIFRVESETGRISPIVLSEPGAGLGQASWTPDGKSLVFRRNGEKGVRVVVREIASGEERTVLEQRLLFGLTLSPDGRQIAYLLNDRGTKTTTLNRMAIEGGTPTVIAKMPGAGRNVTAWTPDGRSIVFTIVDDNDKHSLWAVPASGGTPQRLAVDDFNGGIHVRVHPDGRHLAYETGVLTHEIWTLENFLPSREATSSRH